MRRVVREPEFEPPPLPLLSPERLAELASGLPDADDPFPRHYFTGKYEETELESAYQIWHLRLWAPRARLLLGATPVMLAASAFYVSHWNTVILLSNQTQTTLAL
jgi:hypothetical protein